jgi:hypothetical protein
MSEGDKRMTAMRLRSVMTVNNASLQKEERAA